MPELQKLSVLMITFNDSLYIAEAIASILSQSLKEFECIIIDDGSTDDTQSILQAYDDPRMRIITHENNYGRNVARNTALHAATGEYCAWMDSDDASLPYRLEKQIAFMDMHPDVLLSGGHSQIYETNVIRKAPLTDEAIRATMIWHAPLCNSTTMFRREPCLRAGGFSEDFPSCEDYDFWRRLALLPDWRFANLDDVLLRVRRHPHVDRSAEHARRSALASACSKAYLLDLGFPRHELDMEAHMALSGRIDPASIPLQRAREWIERLMQFNREAKKFSPRLFHEICRRQLLGAYVKTPWLPEEVKRLMPAPLKDWLKKGVFALKGRAGGVPCVL